MGCLYKLSGIKQDKKNKKEERRRILLLAVLAMTSFLLLSVMSQRVCVCPQGAVELVAKWAAHVSAAGVFLQGHRPRVPRSPEFPTNTPDTFSC